MYVCIIGYVLCSSNRSMYCTCTLYNVHVCVYFCVALGGREGRVDVQYI